MKNPFTQPGPFSMQSRGKDNTKMKKLIYFLMILLIASSAWAGPFLVSDPAPQGIGIEYKVYEGTTVLKRAFNEADGSLRMDLATIPVGTHTVSAAYLKVENAIEYESIKSATCTFTRPPTSLSYLVKNMRLSADAKFIVSDPLPAAIGTSFEVSEGTAIASLVSQPDGSVKIDISGATVGTHSYQVRYFLPNTLWGTAYSANSPLVWTKPSPVPNAPMGLKLAP